MYTCTPQHAHAQKTSTHTRKNTHAYREASLQHTATHCNTLQHTATHCNTLQHKRTSRSLKSLAKVVVIIILSVHPPTPSPPSLPSIMLFQSRHDRPESRSPPESLLAASVAQWRLIRPTRLICLIPPCLNGRTGVWGA